MNPFAINLPIASLKTLVSGAVVAFLITACSTPSNEVNDDTCTREGTFKSSVVSGVYYKCVWDGSKFLKYVYRCPAGQEFDEVLQRCK
jgi:hypothetical protein